MSTKYVSDGSFNINFSPGEGVTTIRYAVVSAVEQSISKSQEAFESGTLDNIIEISADETVVEISTGEIGPYAVFARGITDSGAQSETQYSQIMAFCAGFTVDNFDLVAMDYTAAIYNMNLAYTGLLVVSKSVLEELGYNIDDLTELYASYGMIEMARNGTSAIAELNGYENYEYVIGVARPVLPMNHCLCRES